MNLNRINYRRIGERGYIFDTKTGYIYLLSETSSIIVEGMLNNSLEGAVNRIRNEYDIDEETLCSDVRELCDLLEELCGK